MRMWRRYSSETTLGLLLANGQILILTTDAETSRRLKNGLIVIGLPKSAEDNDGRLSIMPLIAL
jgi:hypothetical protein